MCFFHAQNKTQLQHPSPREQHRGRFTQSQSCRCLFGRSLFPASLSWLIESGSRKPGFASGSRALRSANASLLHSPHAASSHDGTFPSSFLNESVPEAGHEPIISAIAERLSDVIYDRDCLSNFLNGSKRRLQKLEVKVVSANDEKIFNWDIESCNGGDQGSKIWKWKHEKKSWKIEWLVRCLKKEERRAECFSKQYRNHLGVVSTILRFLPSFCRHEIRELRPFKTLKKSCWKRRRDVVKSAKISICWLSR